MRWVEKIHWDGSSYRVIAITGQGQRDNLPVAALHDFEFTSSGARRIRVRTDFQTWRKVSPEHYLAAMGFPKGTPSGQDIYEFEAEEKKFQVPACVLMKGIFKPLRGLSPHLFRPQGLDNLAVALLDGAKSQIRFFRRQTGLQPERSEGALAALSWMYCFPSPRRMWDSILYYARKGRLALTLPEGKTTLVLQARPHDGKWLVTNLTVIAINTAEKPHSFASGHPQRIEFHQAAKWEGSGHYPLPKRLTDLLSHGSGWRISDEEWTVVESIVTKRKCIRHSLRDIIDCILDKFGQGIPWNLVQYGNVNRNAVVRQYQQMRKDGRWDAMAQVIHELRSPIPIR